MLEPTHFAHLLETSDKRAQYDECVKNLLAQKVILAWILKHCTREFQPYSIEYIADRCIESTPEITTQAVHPDEKVLSPPTGSGERIMGTSVEDKRILEGTVTFDIRFMAQVPKDDKPVQLIINIESQLNTNPGYPLSKRAIYYCCRMISAQYGTLFSNAEYDKIRKVYSIWICPTPSERAGNTIQQFSITEEDVLGNLGIAEKDYDLMTVILLRLGEKGESSENKLIRMLSIMLSPTQTAEEKKKVLEGEYQIPMTKELNREVQTMDDVFESILMEGMKEGKKEGIILGAIEVYREIGLRDNLIATRIMEKYHLSKEKAEEYLLTKEKV